MFWKLALTLAVVLLALGREGPHRNLLARLLLPRAWADRLSLITPPAQSREGPKAGNGSRAKDRADAEADARPRSAWGDRLYVALVVVAATAVAAWVITRTLISTGAVDSP